MPALVLRSGAMAGDRIEVGSAVLVGRVNATLMLPDPEVSRQHAVVRPVEDGMEVEDLGSLNGTWVNGNRIEGPTRLSHGDIMRMGDTEIAVELEAPAVRAPATRLGAPAAAGPSQEVGPAPQPVLEPVPEAPQPVPAARAAAPPPAAGFQPPAAPTRRHTPATRSRVHIVVTFSAIAVTAILLIAYFALRTPPP